MASDDYSEKKKYILREKDRTLEMEQKRENIEEQADFTNKTNVLELLTNT